MKVLNCVPDIQNYNGGPTVCIFNILCAKRWHLHRKFQFGRETNFKTVGTFFWRNYVTEILSETVQGQSWVSFQSIKVKSVSVSKKVLVWTDVKTVKTTG